MAQEHSFGTRPVPLRTLPFPGTEEVTERGEENISGDRAVRIGVQEPHTNGPASWTAGQSNMTLIGYVKEPDLEADTAQEVVAKRATIILPAYNEAKAMPSVLADLTRVLDKSYEIIVVDDGSSDGTPDLARKYDCQVIEHDVNQGKGAAVRTGLKHANSDIVIIMDADNTYPAEAIPGMVDMLGQYDFVRGIRTVDKSNTPLVNRMGNKAFDSVLKVVYGMEGGDHLSGLYGLRRDAFESMKFNADGFDLEVEIGIKARAHELRTSWMDIDYKERLGEKKLNPIRDGWRILQKIMALTLLYNPGRMFIAPAVVMLTLSIVLALTLQGGPVVIPAFNMSLQSFVISALGITISLQVLVYGLVAALYAVEKGVRARMWLIRLTGRRVRFGIAATGMILALMGSVVLVDQLARGALYGTQVVATEALVLAAVLVLTGLQAVLAIMFLSIFATQLDKLAPTTRKVSRPQSKARLSVSRLRRARS